MCLAVEKIVLLPLIWSIKKSAWLDAELYKIGGILVRESPSSSNDHEPSIAEN